MLARIAMFPPCFLLYPMPPCRVLAALSLCTSAFSQPSYCDHYYYSVVCDSQALSMRSSRVSFSRCTLVLPILCWRCFPALLHAFFLRSSHVSRCPYCVLPAFFLRLPALFLHSRFVSFMRSPCALPVCVSCVLPAFSLHGLHDLFLRSYCVAFFLHAFHVLALCSLCVSPAFFLRSFPKFFPHFPCVFSAFLLFPFVHPAFVFLLRASPPSSFALPDRVDPALFLFSWAPHATLSVAPEMGVRKESPMGL